MVLSGTCPKVLDRRGPVRILQVVWRGSLNAPVAVPSAGPVALVPRVPEAFRGEVHAQPSRTAGPQGRAEVSWQGRTLQRPRHVPHARRYLTLRGGARPGRDPVRWWLHRVRGGHVREQRRR